MKIVKPIRVTRSYTQKLVATPDAVFPGPEGDAFVAAFTEDHFRAMMRNWETRLNHCLRCGKALPADGG